MPRTCTVCSHPNRAEIDRALVRGESFRNVAKQHSVSTTALFRHRWEHIPKLLTQAQAAEETAHADTLLDQLRSLQQRTLSILDQAEHSGDARAALGAIGEARRNLELLAKLLGELDERPQLNLLIAPEWLTVRAEIIAALGAFPEARVAVAERLALMGAGQ